MASFHCKPVVCLSLEHGIPFLLPLFQKDAGDGEGSFREGPLTGQ